ncbi:MAG TPA: hypothetical protein ENI07_14980 [Desulfobacterales bacterium]|nr:hypothetical protein [Desulfobacterales bacterium]
MNECWRFIVPEEFEVFTHKDMEGVRVPECCETWNKATKEGTDNEGFQALIWFEDGYPKTGNIGSDTELPPLKLCPWCGEKRDG